MAEPFDTHEDTLMYLDRSVCMLGDMPVWVEVRGRNLANVLPLDGSGAGWQAIATTRDDFHWNNMQLGYCNVGNHAVFLKRTPDRRQKVGLTNANLVSSDGKGRVDLVSVNVGDTLRNRYPTFEEALAWIKKTRTKGHGRAFHRLFMLSRIDRGLIGLHFRERLVAVRTGKSFLLVEGEDTSIIYRLLARFNIELTEK